MVILRKIIFATLVLTFIGCERLNEEEENVIQNLNCLPSNLQNGVVAFYTFGNGSLNDSSGNNYNLTNPTSAISGMDRAGNPNCAYQFDDANDEFLKYTNPTFLDNLPLNNLSISFWFKSNDSQASYGMFICRDDQISCTNYSRGEWSVGYSNSFKVLHLPNGGLYHHEMQNTNWEHIVITSNSTNNQMYVNGVQVSSGIGSYSCPILNQGDLFIGKFYKGLIDDVIIYNRVISPSEVIELFNLNACCN